MLGRVIPGWRTADVPDDSLVVLGEAVLRLLGVLAGSRGLVVVLEDMHWADLETLAVLEYLADNVAEERVLLLGTCRDVPGAATVLFRTLAERHACTFMTPAPLSPAEVGEMAAACLGGAVPDDVLAALQRRAGGTPLLVEELLAAGASIADAVPATVADLVTGRADALGPAARRCVEAAAVLGAEFDWTLLPTMLDTGDDEVLLVLREATRAGLVEPRDGDGFRFHHALGRDAVLAAQLPPERAVWARRGLAAVAAAHPGLENGWCDLAAALALRAGDTARAAEVLVEAGRRNLAAGALASAEAVLTHAGELTGGHGELAAAADDLLAEVLALAGKTTEAATATNRTIARWERVPGAGRALTDAHLRLVHIYTTAGEWAAADKGLAAARELGVTDADLPGRIASAAAQVALGDSRFAEAQRFAREALAAGEDTGDIQVRCDALLVLGRIARRTDLAAAEALIARAGAEAEEAGLAVATLHALSELAIGDVQQSLRLDRLAEARSRAAALGDIAAVAVLDLQAIATHNARWEPAGLSRRPGGASPRHADSGSPPAQGARARRRGRGTPGARGGGRGSHGRGRLPSTGRQPPLRRMTCRGSPPSAANGTWSAAPSAGRSPRTSPWSRPR